MAESGYRSTLRQGQRAVYSEEAECPNVTIRLQTGYDEYKRDLHDWRLILDTGRDAFIWYCTRCRKISSKQPRRKKRP